MQSPPSSYLKVARAQELLAEITDLSDAETSEKLRPGKFEDVSPGEWTVSFVEPGIDPRLGLLIGDYVANLRAALDHLVYALSGERSTTQFPVSSSQSWYTQNKPGQLSLRDKSLLGVSEDHKKLIDAHQPFNNKPNVKEHPLAVLVDLNNIDKHRYLHAALRTIGDVRAEVESPHYPESIGFKIEFLPPGRLIDDGQELGTFSIGSPFGDSFHGKGLIYGGALEFGEIRADNEKLREIGETVLGILHEFN
jgi:hypothetical protein